MNEENAPERPRRVTSEAERRRRRTIGRYIAAVLVGLPGAYAAVRGQDAADARVVKTEVAVRDAQEAAFRKHFEALRREVAAVREAAVTHRELLDLVMKLRAERAAERARSNSNTRRHRATQTSRERELERELADLRRREVEAKRANRAATAVQRALPKLKPARVVRKAMREKF